MIGQKVPARPRKVASEVVGCKSDSNLLSPRFRLRISESADSAPRAARTPLSCRLPSQTSFSEMTWEETWFTEFPHAGGIFRDHRSPDRPSGGSGEPDDTAELNDRIDRQQLLSGESVADDWFEVLEAISCRQTRFLRADVIPFRLAIVASFLLEY